jgi:nucleoid-associated protein YgaU
VEPENVETPVEPVTEVATLEAPEPTLPETTAAPDPQTTPEPVTEQVAILKSNETGVEIINRSSAPDVMSNVAIDTISYSQDGDVLLSGRAQSQASVVRVYLNNAVVTTLEVDTKGRWRGDLPDVDTGIYTLRVDEVDDVGDVTSRVETPFKREAPAILAAAQRDVDAPVKAITVQTGATLWAIARDRYGDGTLFVRVVDANKDSIRNPDLIYPGQVFELPE